MRSGTFLYEIRFPTTFILSFFLWDAYFVLSRMNSAVLVDYFNHIHLSSPLAPLRGEIHICAQGLFHTKFDSLQLLS